MIVQIAYRVPVEVLVDTDKGTVTRVVVIDEAVEVDPDDLAKDGKAIHDDAYIPIEDETVRVEAFKIAEAANWPAWEFGF